MSTSFSGSGRRSPEFREDPFFYLAVALLMHRPINRDFLMTETFFNAPPAFLPSSCRSQHRGGVKHTLAVLAFGEEHR